MEKNQITMTKREGNLSASFCLICANLQTCMSILHAHENGQHNKKSYISIFPVFPKISFFSDSVPNGLLAQDIII